ncbi:hypothetical protein BAOM_4737 [Peribacillus asahii]|uniref:Uncharacterized protein n=1 Tax=Peribacillus asahii TaxID=228899 RepID=A0A3T0KYA6_9BACI|nr:hypothetical protein [Peribacillus asahii]AZV45315.1 hypothetical protein BAOM_4737 [Peribacillus asahii]
MKRIIVPIVGLITIGTLIGGNFYWKHNVNETVQAAKQALTETESNASNQISSEKKSVKQIKKEYSALFEELEAQETSKIDQLMVAAKADYVSKKDSKTEITGKYQETAQELEKKADQSFNALYQQLQYDLEKNGHNVKEAEQFQRTYKEKKKERYKRILSQVKDF